jgi:hypothetical protein
MPRMFGLSEHLVKGFVRVVGDDTIGGRSYHLNMAGKPSSQKDFKHTWFLQEWMRQSVPPKRQADLIRDLGWPRAKASNVYNGQQYTQALIDQLAPWLNIRPWELLMAPNEAMAIRRVREAVAQIAGPPGGQPKDRTGTDG